jgi:hypothetical protein
MLSCKESLIKENARFLVATSLLRKIREKKSLRFDYQIHINR